jgi:hypothetical protein
VPAGPDTKRSKSFGAARRLKKDEFYTQLTDIEKEMVHYRRDFSGQVIYCNADDPRISNFFRFFSLNFERFGLKKLITTSYQSRDANLFSKNDSEQAVFLEYEGDVNGNGVPDLDEIGIEPLVGDGDFRSPESIALLQQADVVVTNPPFSLFREFLAQLIEYDKKFIILGNMNAVTYKEVFDLIRSNRVWYGPSISAGDRWFGVPDGYPLTAANSRVDPDGSKYIRVKGVRWFTNLDHKKRHEDLILYKKYTPDEYPKYDNLDAIDVTKTTHIPVDYDGLMGVPITFLDRYNPDQFEIVGGFTNGSLAVDLGAQMMYVETGGITRKWNGPIINRRPLFKRIVIRRRS